MPYTSKENRTAALDGLQGSLHRYYRMKMEQFVVAVLLPAVPWERVSLMSLTSGEKLHLQQALLDGEAVEDAVLERLLVKKAWDASVEVERKGGYDNTQF